MFQVLPIVTHPTTLGTSDSHFQRAQALQSAGFFITTNSAFGNSILPVLPRIEKKYSTAMATMKLKKLQHALEDIETFQNPKIELEQYTTSSHIAACILHTAELVYNDINGKCVADLGCGSGVLNIDAALLGAQNAGSFVCYQPNHSLLLMN
ncbi:hypothetical protein QTP88_021375 [Uroleucon formosanum]